MANAEEDGGIGAEVSSRLDELFGDENDSEDFGLDAVPEKKTDAVKPGPKKIAEPRGSAKDVEQSPIKNLKALVFGIDWEISDDSMASFLKEVRALQQKYKTDKILSMFLKLHESIGKYIKAKKAHAHPDALKFVTSVFTSFEKVLLTSGMPENQRKKLLNGEVKKFKEFKERILTQKNSLESARPQIEAPVERDAGQLESTAAEPAVSLSDQEAVQYIVEELKKTIKAEFHTLRQILKNLGT